MLGAVSKLRKLLPVHHCTCLQVLENTQLSKKTKKNPLILLEKKKNGGSFFETLPHKYNNTMLSPENSISSEIPP